jgi:hypothetical protein
MIEGVDHKRTTYLLKLGKNNLRMLTGIITGHNTLNRHLKPWPCFPPTLWGGRN